MMIKSLRKPSHLNLAFWNANGVKNKRYQLEEFADEHNLDLVLLSETHLKPGNNLRLPNYDVYRNDRLDRELGGTAILIKRSIAHHRISTPALQNLEATTVSVDTSHGPLLVTSVYKPPNHRLLPADLDLLLQDQRPKLVAGDLNAKHTAWNSRNINASGNILLNYASSNTIFVDGPIAPTRYDAHALPNVLDIALLKNVPFVHKLETGYELDSDHNPVHMELGDPEEEQIETISRTCWPSFHLWMDNHLEPIRPISTVDELEAAVQDFTTKIQEGIKHSTKEKEKSKTGVLPPEIKDLIRQKNRARKRWQQTWDPESHAEYNRLKRLVANELKAHHNSMWENKLENLTTEDCSLWKMARSLRNKTEKMPPIHGANGLAHTDQEKAEAFVNNLELQCSPNLQHADLDWVDQVERETERFLNDEHQSLIEAASPKEVKQLINQSKNRKAPGPDGIRNEALKALPKKGVAHLAHLINATQRLHHFPSQWKVADVIVIRKSGQNSTFPQNYRPISLISTLGKIAEGVVLKRLEKVVEDKNIIPPEQFGFRPNHSATQQVLRLVEFTTEGFNDKKSTGVILLDVSKAFDKVWHHGLLYRLIQYEFPPHLIKLIASFLRERQATVRIGPTRSTGRTLTAGVPQGSKLSPSLFNIYASNMPQPRGAEIAQFADDTAIMSKATTVREITDNLQRAAAQLERWYRTWLLGVNPEKSKALFLSKRLHNPLHQVRMFGVPLEWTNKARYLGVTLDRRLTWRPHIEERVRVANGAVGSLLPLLHRRSKLSTENKLRIYNAIIKPILTYAAVIWATAAPSHLHFMQRVQNKILRMTVAAPWFVRNATIHDDLGVPSICETVQLQAREQIMAVEYHLNPLLRRYANYEAEDARRHKRPRTVLWV